MVTQSWKRDDRIGKVFLYISDDERRCLVCLQSFSRLGSLDHSRRICHPVTSSECQLAGKPGSDFPPR